MTEQNQGATSLGRRTWPFLIGGLGTLVLLIFFAGLALWEHARAIQTEAMETQREFAQMDHALEKLRLETLSTAIDVRDYMLEDSPELNRLQKAKLAERKVQLFQALDEVERLRANRAASATGLKNQIAAFWSKVEWVLSWSTAERHANWTTAIRATVVPGRQAVLNQAAQISAQNAEYLEQRQTALRGSFEGLKDYLLKGLIWVLCLALGISALTVWKITALEKRASRNKLELERLSGELRHLSQALVQVQEEERKSLSRELHDEVGQMITVLRMELGTAEQHAASDSAALPHLRAAATLADQTLRSIRSLARGLRPSMLDELGVVPALNWLAREFNKHGGINVSVATDGEMDKVPESYRTCIYRIAQEALTNCARHARAHQVLLELKRAGNTLSLKIQDDGAGFDLNQPAAGMGLVGMKERVRELNGKLTIETGPDKGTLLKVQIPLWEEIAA
jgi:signal transduction histidine kinase